MPTQFIVQWSIIDDTKWHVYLIHSFYVILDFGDLATTMSLPLLWLLHNCIFPIAFIVTCCFLNQYFVHNFWSLWNEVFTPHHPFHIRASSISLGVPELIATISNLHKASLSDSFLRILLQNLWAFCHPWNVFSWLTARTSTEN